MSSWNMGLLGAAGGGAALSNYELLQSALISTNTASVTFSSLSQYSSYKHLQIKFSLRNSNTNNTLSISFNGITNAAYKQHGLRGNGTSALAFQQGDNTNWILDFGTGANFYTDVYAAGIIDISDFNNSSKIPVFSMVHGFCDQNQGTRVGILSGIYPSAQAWSSIKFEPNGQFGSFAPGSRISLYGSTG